MCAWGEGVGGGAGGEGGRACIKKQPPILSPATVFKYTIFYLYTQVHNSFSEILRVRCAWNSELIRI